jgi:tRNA pseudouridine55 synthase
MDGVLVIDKPVGPTSHDVVARIRRALGEQRVGHTGTLDPGAGGVLPLVVGRATRLARFLSAGDKHYEAVIRLGSSTDTGDAFGARIGVEYRGALPSAAVIDAALEGFRGTHPQRPPSFSAKKIQGRRSYALAREGRTPHPAPVLVTAHAIEVLAVDREIVTLRVVCSAGFYIRSLAHDLGDRLGTGGHLMALRRTASGGFGLSDAITLDAAEDDHAAAVRAMVPLAALPPGLESVVLTADGAQRAAHGRDLGPDDMVAVPPARAGSRESWIRLLDARGDLVGLARLAPSGAWHPSVVLV